MKIIWEFLPSAVKGVLSVVAFLIGLGWTAFLSVNAIVKAEGRDIRREVKTIRDIDMKHLDKRFDKIEALIKENQK